MTFPVVFEWIVAARITDAEEVPRATFRSPVHLAKPRLSVEEHHPELADYRVKRVVLERQCGRVCYLERDLFVGKKLSRATSIMESLISIAVSSAPWGACCVSDG